VSFFYSRWRSIKAAIHGCKILWEEELNFRIHIWIACICILLGFVLQASPTEWLILLLTFGLVICMEAMNSAIENLANFVCAERNSDIKRIKDISASAVLIAAFIAVGIGFIIFTPKILAYLI